MLSNSVLHIFLFQRSAEEIAERKKKKALTLQLEIQVRLFFPSLQEHPDVLTLGFDVDGVERVIDLRLNTDLIPVSYRQLHQHRGTYKVHNQSKVVSTRLGVQHSHPC